MGIRLDWEIEAERSTVQQAGEDPIARRKRRRGCLWFVILLLGLVALIGGAVALVQWRLRAVDSEIEQLLRNTVEAEVAALRLGDSNAFMNAQRSASADWLRGQGAVFQDYQQLKVQRDVQLTGQILNLSIEDTRARVEVAEVIEGVQYSQIWFYWRYEDGWRHVPVDYTFWGEVQTLTGESVTVTYQTVDASVAAAVLDRTVSWLQLACAALSCPSLPSLNIEIVPDPDQTLDWAAEDQRLLRLPSPYMGRARSDQPFDSAQQLVLGKLLAERLVRDIYPNVRPIYPSDAYYLHQSVLAWLTGRYAGAQANAYLLESLAVAYGESAVGRLLGAMGSGITTGASLIAQAAGVSSPDQATVDWRDLLTWRLALEAELITRQDEANFTLLYDLGDVTAAGLAAQRFNAVPDGLQRVVIASELRPGAVLLARVEVQTGGEPRPEEAQFRLLNGDWKRVN